MTIFYSSQTGGFYDTGIHTQIPADAIEITAAVHRELLSAQSHGAQIQPDANGYPIAVYPPPPTLDELKVQARGQINHVRDKKEQGGFAYLDKVFDSDPVSAARIQGAAQTASYAVMGGNEVDFSIQWTCQDNSVITLDAPQMMGAVVALAEHAGMCHAMASALKAAVDECVTAEEVTALLENDWLK